jgi:hypothetical protein
MSRAEYLRLMRFHREKLIVDARRAFNAFRRSKDEVPTAKLIDALSMLGVKLADDLLEDLLQAHAGAPAVRLDAFVHIVDRAQELAAKETRKRAGFSAREFEVLQRIFDSKREAPTSNITKGQLIGLLSGAFVPMQTLEHREAFFKSLAAARRAAVEVGALEGEVVDNVEPKGEVGDGGRRRRLSENDVVHFWDFLHLVRILIQEKEDAALAREKEAVEQTKFSNGEVAQFRQVFYGMLAELREEEREQEAEHRDEGESLPPDQADQLRDLLRSSALPPCSISFLLTSFGLRASAQQQEDLQEKLHELTAATLELDFSCFLQLMRWMLDTDYANISGTSKKSLDRERHKSNDRLSAVAERVVK